MSLKYFYYISKSKVEMLLPQVHRKRFSLPSISPKIELAGISVGAEIKGEKQDNLITSTLDLIDRLQKSNSIVPMTDIGRLKTSTFYHSTDMWHHGLFYFEAGFCVNRWGFEKKEVGTLTQAVTYLVWKTHGNSIILLVGSPENIMGDKIVEDGIFVPGTISAVEKVMDIVESLRTEEFPAIIRHKGPYGPPEYRGSYGPFTEDVKFQPELYYFDWEEEPVDLPHSRSRSYPLSLAIFCFKHLRNLPEMQIDTVFRVFSCFESSRRDYFLDLCEEYKRISEHWKRRSLSSNRDDEKESYRRIRERWEASIREAENARLQNYNTVYIGSPVYTAIV